jgi:hypothetical protein
VRVRRGFSVCDFGLTEGIVGMDEIVDHGGGGYQLAQQLQSFPRDRCSKEARASDVATRPVEASDEAQFDRIAAATENDGNGGGCRLGDQRRSGIRGDHSDLTANQIGRQGRQSIELTFGPAIFDRDISALNVAGFLETIAERGHIKCKAAW